ncbi:MAG: hypothetical protein ACRD2L_08890, partial [Terriglobia bacterium]
LALLAKQVSQVPTPPREVEPILPIYVEKIILRCLQKKPADRFQNVQELEAALPWKAETKDATAAVLSLPTSLSRPQRFDYLLVVLGILGAVAYFSLQERIFPARRLQLRVDRSVAVRAAKDFALKLDAPHAVVRSADLALDSAPWNHLMRTEGRDNTWAYLPEVKPIRWVVTFSDAGQDEPTVAVSLSATDEDPQLTGFIRNVSSLPPNAPVSVNREEQRRHAEELLEQVVGIDLKKAKVVAEQYGTLENLPQYELHLVPIESGREIQTKYSVGLAGGVPVLVGRYPQLSELPNQPKLAVAARPRVWRLLSYVFLLSVLFTVFVRGRGWIFANWKPILLTTAIFATAYAYWISPGGLGSIYDRLVSSLYTFSFAALLGLLAIGSVTYLVSKVFPSSLVGLSALNNWRSESQAVGLMFLRGTLLGFSFLGLVNTLTEVGVRNELFWLDPSLVGGAIQKAFPAMQGLANAIVQAVLFVLVGGLLPVAFVKGILKGSTMASSFVAAAWVAFIFGGIMSWMQPWAGTVLMLFIPGLVIGLALNKFELVTVGVGAFTYCFWLINFPAYVMLSQTSALSFYFAFAVWGSIPTVGLCAYSWPAVRRVYFRLSEGV